MSQNELLETGIAGNVPVYLKPEEISSAINFIRKYPVRPLPENIQSVLDKLCKTHETIE